MEKAAGVPLFQQWTDMEEIEKLKLIKNLTKLEAQLAAIQFLAYGGLYLQADASMLKLHYQMLDRSIDPSNLFCIGSSCDHSFHFDLATDLGQFEGDVNQGPCEYPGSYKL